MTDKQMLQNFWETNIAPHLERMGASEELRQLGASEGEIEEICDHTEETMREDGLI